MRAFGCLPQCSSFSTLGSSTATKLRMRGDRFLHFAQQTQLMLISVSIDVKRHVRRRENISHTHTSHFTSARIYGRWCQGSSCMIADAFHATPLLPQFQHVSVEHCETITVATIPPLHR
ncbi:Hypothetical protein, putative [Bodo saltans]|uniref:Uncharacterized protein n=1 Tax=Bodo saltans TaxID=75058 RepID=A0A0S4JNG5_BODSA|nr:Hypothetical protein, putative [Bodo saltans]|eukprot:CUG91766.1 Hypothetical protein, putative [Bodo saltans]